MLQNMNLYSRGDKLFVRINMLLIGLFTISALYPFIYITAVSMSSGEAARAGTVVLSPIGLNFEAYKLILTESKFWLSYMNTFIYTIGGTILSLIIIIPASYALSRPQLIGRRFWNFMVAFTMWFNAGMIPFYLNMRDLNLLDSYFIPASFEEAARLDGANEFQVLWKVFVPLSKPAIVTITLFCVVARWNGFFWAMVLLSDENKIPLQVYLRHKMVTLSDDEDFVSTVVGAAYSVETVTAAIIVCSTIPVLLFYPYIQKYFNKGIMLGGVKE